MKKNAFSVKDTTVAHKRHLVPILLTLGSIAFTVFSSGCRVAAPPSLQSQTPPNTQSIFRDVTGAAGIRYEWRVEGKRPLNILQTIGNGCAFLDFDNDGNLDILLVGKKLALYKGDGKGHFADVSSATGLDKLSGDFRGCAVGDYDNDGFSDLYISGYRTGLLLRNTGGKTFTDVTAQAGLKPQPWGTSCAWGDIDGDGRLDLYVGNYIRYSPDMKLQLCDFDGHLSACGPKFYDAERGALYRNLGGSRFEDATKAWGADKVSGKTLGVAFCDFDGSGRQSLFLSNDQVPGNLLRNEGRSFKDIGVLTGVSYDKTGNVYAGMGTDWGDYDNDGKLDLTAMAFRSQEKFVFRNEDHFFTEKSSGLGLQPANPYVAFGVKWLDYNNDGWLDLMIANGHVQDNIAEIDKAATYKEPTLLFQNQNGVRFTDVTSQMDEAARRAVVGRGLATGDFDNDGRIDALVVDGEGAPLLLHNETTTAGNYVSLRLIGTKSNRSAYGARITVEAEGKTQVRVCHTDGSYLSASDSRVHVGLGGAKTATITVRWPTGKTETMKTVSVNQTLTLTEGKMH